MTPASLPWQWAQQLQGERLVGVFRLLAIALNSATWLLLPQPGAARPALAALLITASWCYVATDLWLTRRRSRLPRRFPLGSALVDLGMIVAWVWATGGAESRYAALFFAGTVALPIRVSPRLAIVGTLLYASADVALGLHPAGDWTTPAYLMLVGLFFTAYVTLTRRQQQESIRDPLTATYGRAYGLFCLQRLLRQGDMGAVVALIDLDGLKKINDTYGHPAGDEALVQCARTMMNQLRAYDILSRYGGDEFLLVLPNLDAHRAYEVLERLRRNVETMTVQLRGTRTIIRLTLSVGFVEVAPGARVQEVLKNADACLYQAKETRNRVVTAEPTDSIPPRHLWWAEPGGTGPQ